MRILMVSCSRADKGSLEPVRGQLAVRGHNVRWLDVDHVAGVDKSETLVAAHTAVMGKVTSALNERKPAALVMLLGDRYEALAAATAAYLCGVPIAHLSGGDVTEGSPDDSMRHAISKLASLHFTTCQPSAIRLIQMGESPGRIYVTGCPGIDSLLNTKLLGRASTLLGYSFSDDVKYFLVGYHPNPRGDTQAEVTELTKAMNLVRGVGYVLLDPNKDLGHSFIVRAFEAYARNVEGVRYKPNLLREDYLSLMRHCVALVGNSSAGFYEAPAMGIPVVNIGDRQKGRISSPGLIHAPASAKEIADCMTRTLSSKEKPKPSYVYGDGTASEKIAQIISDYYSNPKVLLTKRFYDLEGSWRSTLFGNKSTKNVNGAATRKKSLSVGLPETTTNQSEIKSPF